ncbi:cytochrome P450 85A1 isoform X1 [Sesamum indicum]|uniref:Cytochrome P450 85A1 isoform X1 n=1 Tax=Sesamum indicum TaxID=4182 RepID=A0A6I9TGS8_SESIN|nr:cytochrome P450 85A1 isoform X1 [Sesamum indicum]
MWNMKEDVHQILINNMNDYAGASVVIAVGLAAVLVMIFQWYPKGRKGSEIPGKLGLPFLGETFAFLAAVNSTRGCYDFVRLRRLRYGKWFKTRILGKTHVYVPSVEGAKTVFANDFVMFNKRYLKSMGDMVGKNSLLCVPKEIHGRMRHLLADPFSMNSVSKFVPKFDRELSERLKRLENSGKSFRVLEFSMKAAFDGICDMLISITDASTLDQLEHDITCVTDAMLSFPLMIPGTGYYRGMKARERLIDTFKAKITKRRNGEEVSDDFLQSMLQRDSYPPNEKLDDEEIVDNLLTLIIAGQSTTAAAIMWCVKFLDENKQAQDKLREEQLQILRNKPAGALLKYDDLMSMSYGSKVVKETLRMSNVLLWYPRVALDNCTIEGKFRLLNQPKNVALFLLSDCSLLWITCLALDMFVPAGYEIKKGWNVNIDATQIHYDPNTYKDPMRFNPSRFDEMQKPYSYIPFGLGPRTCLGINMAKATMLVFLHRLTSGYTWTVDDEDLSLERKAHIPRLRSGCPITLTRLDDTSITNS